MNPRKSMIAVLIWLGGCSPGDLAPAGAGAAPEVAAEPAIIDPIWASSDPKDRWLRCPPGAHAEWREPLMGRYGPPRCVLEPIRGPGRP